MTEPNFSAPTGTNEGYYPRFELPSWFDGPEPLRALLGTLWSEKYFELYENDDSTHRTRDAFVAVVDALWDEGGRPGHRRLLWMGYALALAAGHMVRIHRPDESRIEQVLDATRAAIRGDEVDLDPDELFPMQSLGDMTLDEAIDVYRNLVGALRSEHARERILEILETCIEDSAIFPGSDGRRDLFNWWLVQVVPAAWCERLPDRIYTDAWSWPPGKQ